jgi:hypothetical protein
MFSTVTGCSPKFLSGMCWRAQQHFFVSEVGESSKWDDLKVGVVDYPEAMQDARSCYHTRGISYGWMRRVF